MPKGNPGVPKSVEHRKKLSGPKSVEHRKKLSEANLRPEIQAKRSATMLEKYGVKYPLQSPEIRHSMQKTMLDKYGVEFSALMPNKNLFKEEYWMEKGLSSATAKKTYIQYAKRKLIESTTAC